MKYAIIDAHAHIFPEKIAEKAVASIGNYYGISMYGRGTVEDLLISGEKIGTKKYIVHSTATKVEQVRPINDYIAAVQASNDKFIGFGTLHPGLDNVHAEVNRIISMNLKGIKLHPDFQEFNIDDESVMSIYDNLEGRLPVLIHMGDELKTSSRPLRLAKVLDMYPELIVIAAHLGGYRAWDESMEYLIGRNVYLDTSSSLFMLDKEKAADIIRKHGVDKVLFGTDYPMWSHEEELDRFMRLDLTEDEREKILYKNAAKLLGE